MIIHKMVSTPWVITGEEPGQLSETDEEELPPHCEPLLKEAPITPSRVGELVIELNYGKGELGQVCK